jgi:tripartite ATP-independent transporter DctP family solute receptor
MKKRVYLVLALVLILSLMFTACSSGKKTETPPAAEVKTIVMKGGSAGAPTLPPNVATHALIESVTADSKGRIKLEFYESRQLGDDAEMLEQTMNGTVQFALFSTSMLAKYTPLLDSLQVPFLLNTYEKEFAAARLPEFKAITTEIEKAYNIKILGLYENGIRHFASNKKPINTPADLKGQKLRVVPSNIILSTITAVGGNPTPMAYGEVYTALQNGVIDGTEINWTSIYSEKFYEQLKYVSEIGLFPFPSVFAVNMTFWKTLSPEDQKILETAADKAMDVNLKLMKEIEARGVETATKAGVKVNKIENLEPFIKATEHIYTEYANKHPLMKAFMEKAKTLK